MKIDKQTQTILLYFLIFIVIYYLWLKPLFSKILSPIGLGTTAEQKETERRKQDQLELQVKETAQTGQRMTKSTQEWQVIADQIWEDLHYSAISDNKADAGYQISRVQNDADFWELFRLFGKRREYIIGIPTGSLMNLSQFIKSNLSDEVIQKINNNYKSKGIKFRF